MSRLLRRSSWALGDLRRARHDRPRRDGWRLAGVPRRRVSAPPVFGRRSRRLTGTPVPRAESGDADQLNAQPAGRTPNAPCSATPLPGGFHTATKGSGTFFGRARLIGMWRLSLPVLLAAACLTGGCGQMAGDCSGGSLSGSTCVNTQAAVHWTDARATAAALAYDDAPPGQGEARAGTVSNRHPFAGSRRQVRVQRRVRGS